MKKIAILGSTGSIGTQTLDVVRQNAGELTVTALAAGHNTALWKSRSGSSRPGSRRWPMRRTQEICGSGRRTWK